MRTNVEIDDNLMSEALRLTKISTKKQVIEAALKELINKSQRERLRQMRGKVEWEGSLNQMRTTETYDI
ncbi:MAG: type II toxin-antitoxin system VapB family antitoxin [Spirosomataceae bacterium]